jgi:hypothetical protein
MESRLADGNELERPDAQAKRQQRSRSIAIAVVLAVLVALFYAATIVHMGAGVMERPL